MTRSYAHTPGIGTGLRGYARGTTGARRKWRVTLHLVDGTTHVEDCESHFADAAKWAVRGARRDVVRVEAVMQSNSEEE